MGSKCNWVRVVIVKRRKEMEHGKKGSHLGIIQRREEFIN
jgi:hypothetical protein